MLSARIPLSIDRFGSTAALGYSLSSNGISARSLLFLIYRSIVNLFFTDVPPSEPSANWQCIPPKLVPCKQKQPPNKFVYFRNLKTKEMFVFEFAVNRADVYKSVNCIACIACFKLCKETCLVAVTMAVRLLQTKRFKLFSCL